MKFTTLFSALSLACTFASAHPHDFSPLAERQSSIVLTTSNGGTVQPRLEIRQLANNTAQFSLFILALRSWQQEPQSDPSSFFGIAKIHGVPRVNYNGVDPCFFCGGTDGYCTHGSILFPAWHRVYVAMWEQQFLARVNRIASQFTGSQAATMQAAAQSLRWPYWDWAARGPNGTPVLPAVVTNQRVNIIGLNSQPQTVGNPLYQYNYTDSSGMYYTVYRRFSRTLRYPTTDDNSAASNNGQARNALANNRGTLANNVYTLLTQCKSYLPFSNTGSGTDSCAGSVESIHNLVHGLTGGGGSGSDGHMAVTPVASFDPIFFLHHANVDRVWALWQAINPNNYGGSQSAQGATWTIAQGDNQDQNSNLTPFYKDFMGSFWQPYQVQAWDRTFAYTYPEFVKSGGDVAKIRSYINDLYRTQNATAGSIKRSEESGQARTVNVEARDTSSYQYVCNIRAPRHALQGTYLIYLFNGNPTSEDPSTWDEDTKKIGISGVLSKPGPVEHDVIVSSSVTLTGPLTDIVQKGLLADLSVPLVTIYLKANLRWRIKGPQGQSVDPKSLPGFVVSVVSAPMTISSDPSAFPVYGEFKTLVDVTKDLVGGLTSTLGNTLNGLLG